MLGDTYPGVEIFLFGGEPFVHPEIEYIIHCFNEFNIPFVIQTNLSKYSIEVMKTITEPYTLQASIHPTEISHQDLDDILKENITCRVIDVMFSGKEAIWYYLKAKEEAKDAKVYLTPVTDFGDGKSDQALKEYNELKGDVRYSKLINFEEVERLGKPRSELWASITFSPKGKPCLYKDKYFLYSPELTMYNCCYRIKTDGICPKSKCFLM
jgi:MoaA/NifB/PqqE/SkfB family radical SAM enzyme